MAQTTSKTTNPKRTPKGEIGGIENFIASQKLWDKELTAKASNRSPSSSNFFSKQAELLKSLESKIPKTKKTNYTAHCIEEEHFVDVVSLALDLGLEREVQDLLSTSDKRDAELSDFFDAILDSLQKKINEAFKPQKEEMVNLFLNALHKDGYGFTKKQFSHLENAISNIALAPPTLTFSNHSYDGDEGYYLAIDHNSIETMFIDQSQSTNTAEVELENLIYDEISQISPLAMVMADDDILDMNYDIQTFEDYLGGGFINKFNTPQEVFDKAIKTDLPEDLGMDKEEIEENFTSMINALLNMKEKKNRKEKITSKYKDSHLLNFFKNETEKLKLSVDKQTSILETKGHFSNLQFYSMDINAAELIEQSMQEYYELPDCQSKMRLQSPTKDTISYLIASALSRGVFNIFTILVTLRNPEKIWSKSVIDSYKLQTNI